MHNRSTRRFIWVSLVVQLVGYVYDAVWHGLLNPGFEPATRAEMAHHLATVHLPLYLGAAAVLVSTGAGLLAGGRRSAGGLALPVAFAGALVSAGAEAWHASSHLALDTHSAPVAGILSVIGFLVVLVSMSFSRRGRQRQSAGTSDRRAA